MRAAMSPRIQALIETTKDPAIYRVACPYSLARSIAAVSSISADRV